ncbi:hypothetical protein HDU77_005927 [Chytriomyces hyalinus]|nr:hypothetical protein HDU77_005927 [Chytriomyces hyalinus]
MTSLWYAAGLNSPNKDSSEHMHPSHYTTSMIDAKSFQPTTKDTDETLSHLLSCLSTTQVIDPTLAPFSSPMSTGPNSRRGSNLDDVMIQQHVHHHHLHRPAMLAQSHEGSFRKMGSQVECAAAIKSLSSLSLSECDAAEEAKPLTSHHPLSSSGGGVSSTALECIKLNMMGLSVRDETEEECNQDWQHSHRHRRSTRPASASPTRRVHSLLQKPLNRTFNSFPASMPSSYAYDASLSSRRHKDSSWRRRVPRTVCNVGTTTTVSFADEEMLMCGSTNVLRDDHDARLRRRHPYYRPPLVSAMSRNRSEASTIGDLSHALWLRQRE